MEDHILNLATEKTEIVLLTNRWIPTNLEVHVGSETVRTKDTVKYLRCEVNTKLIYWEQMMSMSDKSTYLIKNLSRLMANV